MSEQIQIGEYTITKFTDANYPNGGVFIQHDNGEGIYVPEYEFMLVIEKYFQEEF